MLVRIVKLSFQPDKIDTFLSNFENDKTYIRNYPGCRLLTLYRDKKNTNVFFTYSYWKTEQDLENYRNSTTFKTIWANTKIYFNAKPEAWSLNTLESLT